jgi:SAM-dependent methyltransferase
VTGANKDHWYDGRFYDLLIAPHQDRAFDKVRGLVADGSSVLDVGCGTGRLAFQLAGKCGRIDGVDPSARNIDVARRRLARRPDPGVRFHHAYAGDFLSESRVRFDYATVSFMIHEIEEGERVPLLRSLSSAARAIIIVDYLVPTSGGWRKSLIEAVEYLAGEDHYGNFKTFVAGGGIPGLIAAAGLHVRSEVRNDPPSTHIVMAGAGVPPGIDGKHPSP